MTTNNALPSEHIQEGNRLIAEGYKILDGGTIIGKKGLPLKLHKGTGGYVQLNTGRDDTQRTYLVHRLVAQLYVPNPDNLLEVNHDDGNKENNWSWNLKWCTRPQNIQHGFDTGLITPPWLGKGGSKHTRSKPVYMCDGCGYPTKEFGSIREAGRLTGINSKCINDALTGKLRSAGGYKWIYKPNNEQNIQP